MIGEGMTKMKWKRLFFNTEMKVKVAQSCPTLCDPADYTVHGILQARIMEWLAFPFSGDLPNPGIEPTSPHCRQILYQLSHKGSPTTRQGSKPIMDSSAEYSKRK